MPPVRGILLRHWSKSVANALPNYEIELRHPSRPKPHARARIVPPLALTGYSNLRQRLRLVPTVFLGAASGQFSASAFEPLCPKAYSAGFRFQVGTEIFTRTMSGRACGRVFLTPKFNLTSNPRPDYLFYRPIALIRFVLALIPTRYQAKGPALLGRIDGWSFTFAQRRLLKTGRRVRGSPAQGVVSAHYQSRPQSIPESAKLQP
jgi:hypothetical protein